MRYWAGLVTIVTGRECAENLSEIYFDVYNSLCLFELRYFRLSDDENFHNGSSEKSLHIF